MSENSDKTVLKFCVSVSLKHVYPTIDDEDEASEDDRIPIPAIRKKEHRIHNISNLPDTQIAQCVA